MTERPQVVLAEDEDDAAEVLRYWLDKAGYQVSVVTTGTEAIEKITQLRPAISILDLSLPEINGLDVIRKVRDEVDMSDLPILVISGRTDIRDIKEAVRAGADEYLIKPVELNELISCIDRYAFS